MQLQYVYVCFWHFYFIFCIVSLLFLLMSHHVILCSVNMILLIISHFDYITYFAGTNGVILMRLECMYCLIWWPYLVFFIFFYIFINFNKPFE